MSNPFDIAANAAQMQNRGSIQATPKIPVSSHVEEDNDNLLGTTPSQKAEVTRLDDNTFIINGRKVQRRANFSKQDLEQQGGWTVDKAIKDGQLVAGEVDEAQTEFLKHTEMID